MSSIAEKIWKDIVCGSGTFQDLKEILKGEIIPKDLKYLRKTIDQWPDSAKHVRLDKDGEVCFDGNNYADYFPEGAFRHHPCFVPSTKSLVTGGYYSKEEVMGE